MQAWCETRALVGALTGAAAVLVAGGARVVEAAPLPGTAIMGLNDGTNLTTTGTPYNHNVGPLTNLNDGNTGTSTDTFYTGGTPTAANLPDSYVGLLFASPVTLPSMNVDLVIHAFIDGGWFGTKNHVQSPIGSDAIAPALQTTIDGGTTWTTITSASSNYVALIGTVTPNTAVAPDVTFQTNVPVVNVNGVRLIGLGGGNAGTGQGFLGVDEISASTPEPASLTLLGLGGLALLARRRRACRAV